MENKNQEKSTVKQTCLTTKQFLIEYRELLAIEPDYYSAQIKEVDKHLESVEQLILLEESSKCNDIDSKILQNVKAKYFVELIRFIRLITEIFQ